MITGSAGKRNLVGWKKHDVFKTHNSFRVYVINGVGNVIGEALQVHCNALRSPMQAVHL